MGVGTGFPITNPTVGGGTAFNDIVAQLIGALGDQRTQRAQVGTDIFSQLLGAETAARRSPVGIIDQLMLAQEFGTINPLSQLGPERLSQFGVNVNPALGNLFDTIRSFAQGALPQATVQNVIRREGQPDQVVVRLPDGSIEIIPVGTGTQVVQGRSGPFNVNFDDVERFNQRASELLEQQLAGLPEAQRAFMLEQLGILGETAAQRQESLADRFRNVSPENRQGLIEEASQVLEHPLGFGGGSTGQPPAGLQGDLNRDQVVNAKDAAILLQRDAGLLDDNFQPVAQLAHGGSVSVDPRARTSSDNTIAGPATIVDRLGQRKAVIGEAGGRETVSNVRPVGRPTQPGRTPLSRPAQADPSLQGLARQVSGPVAQTQGDGGIDTPPATPQDLNALQIAAAGLGAALKGDFRFQGPFVNQLVSGQRPSPTSITMRQLRELHRSNPEAFQALQGIIGVDQFPLWLNSVALGTPTGRGNIGFAAAGGVRV
jgi:hypothetical protein